MLCRSQAGPQTSAFGSEICAKLRLHPENIEEAENRNALTRIPEDIAATILKICAVRPQRDISLLESHLAINQHSGVLGAGAMPFAFSKRTAEGTIKCCREAKAGGESGMKQQRKKSQRLSRHQE